MSATVDGVQWVASTALGMTSVAGQQTIVAISGGNSAWTIGFGVLLTATGTGTYTVAANPGTNFSLTQMVGGQLWSTTAAGAGNSGTVTLTRVTPSRAVGTFSFTGSPAGSSGATGTKVVTNGAFDVTF